VEPECRKEHQTCLGALVELLRADAFKPAQPDVRARVLNEIIAVLSAMGQFSHAADYAVELAGLDPAPRAFPVAIAVSTLRGYTRASVSFEPATGELRERDPLDFLEQERLEVLASDPAYVPRDDRLERARSGVAPGGLLKLPYGATSPSEDGATAVTSLIIADLHPRVKTFLLMALENNIRARNLELPVKLMIDPLTWSILDEKAPGGGGTLRQMLVAAMEADAEPPIPATTREAFEAAEKLATLGDMFAILDRR